MLVIDYELMHLRFDNEKELQMKWLTSEKADAGDHLH